MGGVTLGIPGQGEEGSTWLARGLARQNHGGVDEQLDWGNTYL